MSEDTSPEDSPGPGQDQSPALPEDLAPRLQAVLTRAAALETVDQPHTARGWLDQAYEAAYAEDPVRAAEAARAGLDAPGGQEPTTRLSLLRALASIAEMSGRTAEVSEHIESRAALLEDRGQPHRARMERELGAMLLREPEPFEATVLEGVLDQERRRSQTTADSILGDALVALAVRRVEDGRFEEAHELLTECLSWYERRESLDSPVPEETWAATRMFLAHVHLMSHESLQADAIANLVLSAPANRAVRAAMWMLKAVVEQEAEHGFLAADHALRAVELHAAAGVRKGSASAAALLAGIAADADDQQTSVLAWKVAVAQAEQGEVPEASALTLALGHQLLEADEHALAERVLAGLVRREEAAHRLPGLARALVDLGHAARHQDRPEEALKHWDRAAQLFLEADSPDEAARMLLAAGALLNREDRSEEAADRFRRAVELSRQVVDQDPAVLPQALHALGHVLAELGDESGVALLDEAIALAKDSSAAWHEADFTDTRARALWALRKGPAAVSSALTAADLFTATQDSTSASNAELFAAYVLLEQERAEEASTLFRIIADQQDGAQHVQMAAWLGLAQSLDLLGDDDGALQARQRADEVAHLPDEEPDSADPHQD